MTEGSTTWLQISRRPRGSSSTTYSCGPQTKSWPEKRYFSPGFKIRWVLDSR